MPFSYSVSPYTRYLLSALLLLVLTSNQLALAFIEPCPQTAHANARLLTSDGEQASSQTSNRSDVRHNPVSAQDNRRVNELGNKGDADRHCATSVDKAAEKIEQTASRASSLINCCQSDGCYTNMCQSSIYGFFGHELLAIVPVDSDFHFRTLMQNTADRASSLFRPPIAAIVSF